MTQRSINPALCQRIFPVLVIVLSVGPAAWTLGKARTVWLDTLDISKADSGWGTTQRNKSIDGNVLKIAGKKFRRGIGTHATGMFRIRLDGWTSNFTALVGMDDEVGNAQGSVEFRVVADGKVIWKSGVMHPGDPAKKVDVNLRGKKNLILLVTDGGDDINYDHADWVDARFQYSGKKPFALAREKVKPYILTPPPPKTPRINGPRIFGVRPGSPFLFTIAATGERPMKFSASGLPDSLQLDTGSGRITGRIDKKGTYHVTLQAENALGRSRRDFRIVVGDKICLTPPLGWNSWNCWAGAVDAEKVKSSARAMVESGLINHGWTYINIDDTWQAPRGGPFHAIQGNEKFPDMKELCDYVHGLGLKIGIYSTPWVTSYAGYPGGSSDNKEGDWNKDKQNSKNEGRRSMWHHGKYSFAVNDARQWAAWGFDYMKYDWNPNDVPHVREMAEALRASGRDIVYSLSNSAPFDKVEEWVKWANCWRTTGDIRDTWSSVSGIGFSQDKWAPYAGPGHWNDPDMLVVGKVGWGPRLHPSHLTPDEQYTHISLWCLLSAPMLLGCDLADLDEFTLSLLTNDEVLDVDQDPLGREARRVAQGDKFEIWAKDMEDGSKAVGLFNRGELFEDARTGTIRWDDLGIKGKYRVRDLWRQKDLGVFTGKFTSQVPPHGVVMLRLFPIK